MTNKEAIAILLKSQIFLARHCGKTDMYNAVELALMALEERTQGKWELVHPLQENDTGDYKCSICGWGGFVIKPTNYCPYCGADMRVKE